MNHPNTELTAERKSTASKRDILLLIYPFAVGFVFCQLILFGGLGVSVPIFTAVFYALVLTFLRGRARYDRGFVITLIPVILLALFFFIYDNATLRFFNVIALWGMASLNLCHAAEINSYAPYYARGIADALRVGIVFPLCRLSSGGKAIGSAFSVRSEKRRTALKIILALVIISPLAFIVLGLLASSDEGFSLVMRRFFRLFTDRFWEYAVKVFISVLLAFPIFSLCFSLCTGEKRRLRIYSKPTLEAAVTSAVILLFCAIYLLYIAVQCGYFFSAFSAALPDGFSYAEYARRGFFELLTVAAINLGLMAGAAGLTSRNSGKPLPLLLRVSLLLISALTMLLIATAASKMYMYISMFELTPLRFYTSWFMLLLAVVFILVIIRLFCPRFRISHHIPLALVIMYLALNLISPDAVIAGANLNRYLASPERGIDLPAYSQLSDSMVPYAVRLLDDPKYGAEARQLLEQRADEIKCGPWQDISIARLIAQSTLDDKGIRPQAK